MVEGEETWTGITYTHDRKVEQAHLEKTGTSRMSLGSSEKTRKVQSRLEQNSVGTTLHLEYQGNRWELEDAGIPHRQWRDSKNCSTRQ